MIRSREDDGACRTLAAVESAAYRAPLARTGLLIPAQESRPRSRDGDQFQIRKLIFRSPGVYYLYTHATS